MNGSEVRECRDQPSCTWQNTTAGTYKIKAIGYDANNNDKPVVSNEVTVKVLSAAESANIKVPATVYCNKELNAGQTVTCTTVISKDVVSGYWEVNGQKYTDCTDKTSCTWVNVPAGTYNVSVKVKREIESDYSTSLFTVIAR
nr:hypothetical protein HAGR004_41230 [Bdellovibrio sp. HAGR004]